MIEFLEANLPAVALAVALVIVLLLYLLRGQSDKRRIRHRAPDALDEGAAPAARNQALIDAPSAVTAARLADSGPDIFVGIGEAIAAGAAREVETATLPPVAPAPEEAPEPVNKPTSKARAAPKAKVAPKSKAAPKAKAAPKPKAEAKPKATPKPKPKAAPAPKAKVIATPKPAPPPPKPSPVALPPQAPTAAPAATNDLARIKGLGPKLQTMLPTLGITTLTQIAAWDEAEIDRIDAQLGVFVGRIRKDSWVDQAKFLSDGDVAGFEGKFGKV